MSNAAERERIRSLRPPRPMVDPWRPLDVLVEEERRFDGGIDTWLTVFLAGSECPFTCIFCDLWQYTLDGATPAGAIPRQLQLALADLPAEDPPRRIKLYNASNFFDPRAVPEADLEAIAAQLAAFEVVTVECHPRLVGRACRAFSERLNGDLEVAMGLETVHPEALPRLQKEMTLDDFESALAHLEDWGVGRRAFVLLSPPFVPVQESVLWARRTVEFALRRGVQVVSLIPTRPSAGEMQRLAAAGDFEPPTLAMLEEALVSCLSLPGEGVVLADLWDVEALAGCDECRQRRVRNVAQMNRTGIVSSLTECDSCSS